jgi:hypothetical protein
MQTQLVNNLSPAFGAPYGIQAYLLPLGFAAGPIEGPWISLSGAKNASLEVAGSLGGGSLTLQLVGTNDPAVAGVNRYTVTIGGTIANNDTFTATFTNPGLPNGTEAILVTATGSSTATTLATAMASGINADVNLQALGIGATSAAGVVTVLFPSGAPAQNTAGSNEGPTALFANFTSIVGSKVSTSGTIAVANDTNGTTQGMPSAINALGISSIPAPLPLFIKARVTLTGGTNANVTVALTAAI